MSYSDFLLFLLIGFPKDQFLPLSVLHFKDHVKQYYLIL